MGTEAVKNSILIIDDSELNIKVLTRILEDTYTIHAAINGFDGVDAAKELLPDLILLDIVMPDIDGFEAIVALKTMEQTKDIPVIFITSLSTIENEAKGLSLGGTDYITKPFSETIVKLRVDNQISISNYKRTIENLTIFDSLTGIPGNLNFEARMTVEWRRAIREKTKLSILMSDIDGFSHYNDKYGHPQGDRLIKTIAGIISQTLLLPSDFAARIKGGKFAVLLHDIGRDGAVAVAENIRKAIENMETAQDGDEEVRVHLSTGVETQTPTSADYLADFLRYADEALATAKSQGGNRVLHHERS
ncbi:MAG: diguanylate cyclase [Oscillospiraceae bacterium]|nr:diguanylate cyclase [Oscillospiraceae bacterium]